MSRNVRHSTPATPARKTVRRSSRTTDTSDDDYAGVDLISDSDADEPDVLVAEEQAIIESEEDDTATPRPSINDDSSSWEGFDLASQEEILGEENTFFEDHITRTNKPDFDTQATAWHATTKHTDDEDTQRRVHFDLSDNNSSSSEDSPGPFPDLFLDQNSLNPSFRDVIENGDEAYDDHPSSEESSYWDFHGSDHEIPFEEPAAAEVADDQSEMSDDSTGSSGYETDEGETTEEELPDEAKYVPARSVLRRVPSESSGSEEDITVIRRSFKPRGPKLGSWIHDVSKPFAVLDSHGKKLIMFKAKVRRYSFNESSSRPLLGFPSESEAGTPGAELLSPPDPGDLMLGGVYASMDNHLAGDPIGPPEAFYPFTSVSADGTIAEDSPSSFDEDDLDDEDLWNVEDFLNFGESTSDEEEAAPAEEDDSGNTTADPMSSTPARPPTAADEDQVHPLLNHFSSNNVGAFRRNQTRHQLLSRNAATRESLAFSGPYRQGTLRGIKKGSLAAANTPITPARKRKVPQPTLPSSPGSPLVAAAQNKRKFSGEQHSHKRSRSLF